MEGVDGEPVMIGKAEDYARPLYAIIHLPSIVRVSTTARNESMFYLRIHEVSLERTRYHLIMH